VSIIILRLRDLFAIDFEGQMMLKTAIIELHDCDKVYVSSASEHILEYIKGIPFLASNTPKKIFNKTGDALLAIRGNILK